MLKRTVFISSPCSLSVRLRQLVIRDAVSGETVSRPLEDIGFLVLEHQQITATVTVFQELIEHNAAVIICNAAHMPAGMCTSFSGNTVQQEVVQYQISMSLPLRKRLWRQIVQAKIYNQMCVLRLLGRNYSLLKKEFREVRSGDATNREGIAAKIYWRELFQQADFVRERFGDVPNNLLNYGYAVLRAGITRALVGSGLLPVIGIHHSNKYNSFCLADDIMEPYRPFVDLMTMAVIERHTEIPSDLTPQIKGELLQILTMDCCFQRNRRPLMIALSQTTASLVRCIKAEAQKIDYPEPIEEDEVSALDQ